MAIISTRLELSSKAMGSYQLNLRWRDITRKGRQSLSLIYQEIFLKHIVQAGLPADRVAKIRKEGFFDASGTLIASMPKEDWREVRKALIKARAQDPLIPDPAQVDQPETPLIERRATVSFRNIETPHYLDGIEYPRVDKLPGESQEDFIRRIMESLAGKKYDPGNKKVRHSTNGVAQSCVPRKNYEAEIELQGQMQSHFKRDSFTSREILAKNGFVPRSVCSSFNRFADRPTLLRLVEAEDGSVDLVSGRAFDLKSAQEIASFAFLSQMNLYRDPEKTFLAQGIAEKNGVYYFEFALQSLLPTSPFHGEEKMFRKMAQAYKELGRLSTPLKIQDPQDPNKSYQVLFRPLPAAACQYNWMNSLEKALPASISGEYEARDASIACDKALFAKKETLSEKDVQRHAKRVNLSVADYRKALEHTCYFLKKQDDLWPWEPNVLEPQEELLTRSFLCHLLGIPLIDNCKSVVDRTNVLNAAVTAMKQWLRSGQALPEREGKIAIFDLPKVKVAVDGTLGKFFYPFKELFAYNLHKGVKISELSRGTKGYKFHRGCAQHPALRALLPKRYLKIKKETKTAAITKRWIVPIFSWVLTPLLTQVVATLGLYLGKAKQKEIDKLWAPQKKLWKKGIFGQIGAVALSVFLLILPLQQLAWLILSAYSIAMWDHKPVRILGAVAMPLKMIANADAILPQALINERYRNVAEKQILYTRR